MNKEQKPTSKDEYGPPLGISSSLVTPSSFSPQTSLLPSPPLKSRLQGVRPGMRPSAAEILKLNFPRLESNPLLKSSNRFTVLSHSITSPSLSANLDKIIPAPSSPPQHPSEDFKEKNKDSFIISIEKEWKNEEPIKLATKIIPSPFNYINDHPQKNQKWYEFILVDKDSIELTHNRCKEGVIQYSKIKILKVLSLEDWKQPPYAFKALSREISPQNYNYFDYIKAWERALLINKETHSWFIWFRKGIPLKFPRWFLQWFIDFGPEEDYFPPYTSEMYQYFQEKSTFLPQFY